MKKLLFFFSAALLVMMCVVYTACKKNANGRNTLSLVDDGSVLSLSETEYRDFIAANPPMTGPEAARVSAVGAKMVLGVQQYLASKGQSSLISNYNWEFNLVNNPEVNAWCLPGGKIVVYSGIMPLFLSDTDMAIVMGHEIAHAVLKHGNERMSQQLLVEYGGTALSTLLSSKPAQTQQLFSTAFGVSSSLGVMAFSRKQELEADEAGLYIAATSGYNPQAAVGFWQRMKAASGGSSTPVFLSTHPSDDQRIQRLQEIMPTALGYYHP